MPEHDDWYEVIQDGDKLLQGDLLVACPTFRLNPELPYPLPEQPQDTAEHQNGDIIILTQSCDLEQGKVDAVVCCKHFDLDEAKKFNPQLARASTEIKKGRHARYALLAERAVDPKLSLRIVDLGDIFVLPIRFLEKVAVAQNPRSV